MTAPAPTLAYAREARPRRGPLVALLASAIAVAVVGKLCWDKFAPAVIAHRHLRGLAERVIDGRSTAEAALAVDPPAPIDTCDAYCRQWQELYAAVAGAKPRATDTLLAAEMRRPDGTRRIVGVDLHLTRSEPVGSVTTVATSIDPGGPTRSPRAARAGQVAPLLVFRRAVTIGRATPDPADPSRATFTATADGEPRRYAVYLMDDDRVVIESQKSE